MKWPKVVGPLGCYFSCWAEALAFANRRAGYTSRRHAVYWSSDKNAWLVSQW